MNLTKRREGDAIVIEAGDSRIDAAVAIQFKDKMKELTSEPAERVILDLHTVDFLDSSGLGAVVAAMKLLGSARKLELAGLTPTVAKVFRLTRMDSVFLIHPSVEEALGTGASAA